MKRKRKINIIEEVLKEHEKQGRLLSENKPIFPLFPEDKPKKYTKAEEEEIICDYREEARIYLEDRANKFDYDFYISERIIPNGMERLWLEAAAKRGRVWEQIRYAQIVMLHRNEDLKLISTKKSDLTKFKTKLKESLYYRYKYSYYAFDTIIPRCEEILEEEYKKIYGFLEDRRKFLKQSYKKAQVEREKLIKELEKYKDE